MIKKIEILNRIVKTGVIAVVRAESAEQAVKVIDAAREAPAMEQITRIAPFSFAINARSAIIIPHDNLIQGRLSHMEGMLVDEAALEARLEIEESTSENSRKKA